MRQGSPSDGRVYRRGQRRHGWLIAALAAALGAKPSAAGERHADETCARVVDSAAVEPSVTLFHRMAAVGNLVYIVGGRRMDTRSLLGGRDGPVAATVGKPGPTDVKPGNATAAVAPALMVLNVTKPWTFARQQMDAPTLVSLMGHAVVAIDDRHIVSLFGHARDGTPAGILRFDTQQAEWKVYQTQDAPESRFGHTAVYEPTRRRVYMYGGQLHRGTDADTAMHVLDVTQRTWRRVEPPVGVRLPHSRVWSSSSLLGDHVVSCFGTNGESTVPNNECVLFDLDREVFVPVNTSNPVLSRSHAALVHTSRDDQLLAFGGVNLETGVTLGDAWILDGSDLPNLRWVATNLTESHAHPPVARFGHDMVQLPSAKNLALLFGGIDMHGRGDTAIHVLDTDAWRWDDEFEGVLTGWRSVSLVAVVVGFALFLTMGGMALFMFYRASRPRQTLPPRSRARRPPKPRLPPPLLTVVGSYPSPAPTLTRPGVSGGTASDFWSLPRFTASTASRQADSGGPGGPASGEWRYRAFAADEPGSVSGALMNRLRQLRPAAAGAALAGWQDALARVQRPFRRVSKRRRQKRFHQLLLERADTLCPQYEGLPAEAFDRPPLRVDSSAGAWESSGQFSSGDALLPVCDADRFEGSVAVSPPRARSLPGPSLLPPTRATALRSLLAFDGRDGFSAPSEAGSLGEPGSTDDRDWVEEPGSMDEPDSIDGRYATLGLPVPPLPSECSSSSGSSLGDRLHL